MLSLTKSAVVITVLLFVLLAPNYMVIPGIPDYFDNQRLFELIIIFMILIWAILETNYKVISQKRIFRATTNLLVLISCFSAFFSESARHALLEISLFAGLIYLSLFTATLWKRYTQLFVKVLVNTILLGAAIYIVGFLAGYLASFLEHIPLRWPEPFHGFTNLRFFNQYQLWTLALISLPLFSFKIHDARVRIMIFSIISAWWMMLFASAGRGVLLSLIIAAIATVLVYRDLARPLLRLQFFTLFAGLSVHILLFRVIPFFIVDPLYSGSALTGSLLRFTTMDRLMLWQQALKMAQQHPFFGVGPMHYAWYPNQIAAHPHNSILQLAAEWGLPATLLVLLMCGYSVYCWLKAFNGATLKNTPQTDQQLPIVLFFTLVANMCYSLVDGVIVMPMSQVMMAVVVGLMIGVYSDTQTHDLKEIKTGQFLAYRFFAGIVLVTLIWSSLPDVLPRLTGDHQVIPINFEVTGPRFWHDGGIPH